MAGSCWYPSITADFPSSSRWSLYDDSVIIRLVSGSFFVFWHRLPNGLCYNWVTTKSAEGSGVFNMAVFPMTWPDPPSFCPCSCGLTRIKMSGGAIGTARIGSDRMPCRLLCWHLIDPGWPLGCPCSGSCLAIPTILVISRNHSLTGGWSLVATGGWRRNAWAAAKANAGVILPLYRCSAVFLGAVFGNPLFLFANSLRRE